MTSTFSAPEPAPRGVTAGSPPPAKNPFQAPDFGDAASTTDTTTAVSAGNRDQLNTPFAP